jgi:hypothetical protein
MSKLVACLTVTLALVVTLPSSSLAADRDADQVVVTSQGAPIAGDLRSGRRYDVRYQAISILNRGNRALALIGVRSRNADVLVADGFVSFSTALSSDQGWSFEGLREFYRHIPPGTAIALTVFQRALAGEGSAAAVSDGTLELLFADGSSLSI